MKYFILIAVLACTNLRDYKTVSIEHWKSYPMPTKNEYYKYCDEYQKENETLDDWNVFQKNDSVFATTDWNSLSDTLPFKVKFKQTTLSTIALLAGSKSIIEVEDGLLVAAQHGEFGTSLWWFSKDGKERYEMTDIKSDGNYNKIVKYKNQIYGVTGLHHMVDRPGSIIKIEKENNKWVAKKILKLDSAANFLTFDEGDNFLVGTTKGLYKVHKDLVVENLTKDKFWSSSYSFVKKGNLLYTGMRLGVLKINLNTMDEEWLRPK
jgi:hypothetical protein